MVQVRCFDIPLHLWDDSTFHKVGDGLIGEVVIIRGEIGKFSSGVGWEMF